jgi:hypothetical protein
MVEFDTRPSRSGYLPDAPPAHLLGSVTSFYAPFYVGIRYIINSSIIIIQVLMIRELNMPVIYPLTYARVLMVALTTTENNSRQSDRANK